MIPIIIFNQDGSINEKNDTIMPKKPPSRRTKNRRFTRFILSRKAEIVRAIELLEEKEKLPENHIEYQKLRMINDIIENYQNL